VPAGSDAAPYYDVTRDGSIAPNDALAVVNYLNADVAAAATFLEADTATQGNWKGKYGGNGVGLNSRLMDIPGYATMSFTDGLTEVYDYVHAESTSDPRALQEPFGGGRYAAEWTGDHGFTLNLNIKDGSSHRVALYMLDWGPNGRSQQLEVFDANNGELLDTQTVESFGGGVYLVWSLRGNLKIRFTNLANGLNTVLSGVFFG
jgi:hypothetical protein